MRDLRRVLAVSCCLAIVLVSGPTNAMSVADEKELGRRFALQAAGQLPTVEDPVVVELVRDIGARLVTTLGPQPFEYQFQVVANPTLNAFAVPGGYIWVFGGLIAQVSTVDELASVMGHEVAHVHAHHIVRQREQTQLWNYAALLGVLLAAVQPVLGAGAMAAAQAATLRYSRAFEEEADYLGLGFMHAAGYQLGAMPSFFKKVLATQRLNPTSMPPYLLTHPLTENRIAHVETSLAMVKRERRTAAPDRGRDLEEARAVVLASGDSAEAVVTQYQQRAAAAPKDGFAQYLLGVVYATVGRLDAAMAAFDRARALGGGGERLPMRMAHAQLRQRRPAEARALLEPYVAAHGTDVAARELLAQTLLELGDEPHGIAQLEGALALDPDLAESHRLLGLAYGRAGRNGDAFFHLARAFELRGKHGEALAQYVRARDVLGDDDPRARRIAIAIEDLTEIVGPAARRRAER